MLWLTWRQHRWQLIGTAAVLVAYWGLLLYGGVAARQVPQSCLAEFPPWATKPSGSCADQLTRFNDIGNVLGTILPFGNLLPLVIGVFWGTPLIARELEQGTYRLALTQSVSRRRWLTTKLGVFGGAAALGGGITGALTSWTQADFEPIAGYIGGWPASFGNPVMFAQSGAVPVATWVFALLAGVALGAVLRRTMTAAAVTLVLLPLTFAGLVQLRPHYLPPTEIVVAHAQDFDADAYTVSPMAFYPAGWVYATAHLDDAGNVVPGNDAVGFPLSDDRYCYLDNRNGQALPGRLDYDKVSVEDCLRMRITYQPAERYPWFQLIEIGLLLAVSGALFVVVRRRVTHHLC